KTRGTCVQTAESRNIDGRQSRVAIATVGDCAHRLNAALIAAAWRNEDDALPCRRTARESWVDDGVR
ncbi:MAG: hypothetical protein ACK559_16345, partial [bacterium]